MSAKNQQTKKELWNQVPMDLIKETIGEWPQEVVLQITGAKISGFRVGKIPRELLKDRVFKKYEKFPGVQKKLSGSNRSKP